MPGTRPRQPATMRNHWVLDPSHETLHQPSDDPEEPIRGGPRRLSRRRLDRRRALADQARDVPQSHSPAEARTLLESAGLKPAAAASQGGLLLSQGTERVVHWDHFRRRLALLQELGVPTLIVTPDFVRQPGLDDYARAAAGLGEAAELAASFGVRIALEFQKSSPDLLVPRDGAGPDRSVGSRQRRRLLRRVPLLHRSEQVRGPGLPVAAQPGVGAGVRRERHPARAGRRRRPDLARRGRLPARADHRPPGANRLRRLCLARGAQSSALAGRSPIASPTWAIRLCAACWAVGSQTTGGRTGRALSMSSVATLQPAAAVYREEQYFDWRVYALIALVGLLTGLGLLRGRIWSARSRTRPGHRPGLLDVRGRLPLAHDHGSEPDRSPRLVRLGPDLSAYRVDPHDSKRGSRELSPHRRLRILGSSCRPRRRASVHRPRHSRRPPRADRRHRSS